MNLAEEKAWFIHNEKEQIWTADGWGNSFAEAVIYRTEEEASKLAEALRTVFPEREIGYNPMFEIYSISVEDKTKPLMEDLEYTENKAHPFTSFYARPKIFFDHERAEKEADRLWFDVFEENPDIVVTVVFAGGSGSLRFCSFSQEEQTEWFEKRKQEWRRKREEEGEEV